MASNIGLATAFNVAIGFSAILGNGLVIFVMTVRREQFSSFTNRLIRHQSIIDFICGLVFLAVTGVRQSSLFENVDENFMGEMLCRLIYSNCIVLGLSGTSTYNLVLISLERFIATCYPVKHRNYCSLFKIKVSMYAVWVIGFTYALVFLCVYKVSENQCSFNHDMGSVAEATLFCLSFVVEYAIPVTLISFSYIKILLVLRQKLDNANADQQDGVFSKAKRNVIMTMLIAGCMFFICWTPVELMRLLLTSNVVTTKTPQVGYVLGAFTELVMCNISVNPVVYCYKYDHFRTQLKQLVRSRFGRSRVRPGEADGPTLSVPDSRGTAPVNLD